MVIPKNKNLSFSCFINKFAHCPCYLVMNMIVLIVLNACYFRCSSISNRSYNLHDKAESLENYAIDQSI